MNELVGTDIRC